MDCVVWLFEWKSIFALHEMGITLHDLLALGGTWSAMIFCNISKIWFRDEAPVNMSV